VIKKVIKLIKTTAFRRPPRYLRIMLCCLKRKYRTPITPILEYCSMLSGSGMARTS